jgi:hypothetical protein
MCQTARFDFIQPRGGYTTSLHVVKLVEVFRHRGIYISAKEHFEISPLTVFLQVVLLEEE